MTLSSNTTFDDRDETPREISTVNEHQQIPLHSMPEKDTSNNTNFPKALARKKKN